MGGMLYIADVVGHSVISTIVSDGEDILSIIDIVNAFL